MLLGGELPCFLGERHPDPSQLPQLSARHHPLPWHIYYPYVHTSHTCSQVRNTVFLEYLFQLSPGKNRRKSQQPFHSLQERGLEVPVCFLEEPQWAQQLVRQASCTHIPLLTRRCLFLQTPFTDQLWKRDVSPSN